MGCDIHIFIETRLNKKELWSSFGGELTINRNYTLFCILNKDMGRVEVENGFIGKGIPDYLGYEAQSEISDADNHSHSWLRTEDLDIALQIYYGRLDHWKAIELEAILAMLQSFEKNGWESRIVFWFDN